jgi:serine/threonine protein kinase/tetratricopeptide (TPR) repeat protein
MDPDRSRQIDQLYLSALEREPRLRGAFLAEACHGDVELRREIESLLAQQASCDGAPSRPLIDLSGSSTLDPITVGTELTPSHTHPLTPGSFLARRFRVVREVGSGGMGLVYEAIDEKLKRRVALKCARPGYGDRLPPEVRAAREVSHFNVCKVHDLHSVSTRLGEMEFVSMEFIEGQTLSERISREGPLPEAEARSIARQVCAGLAQAHRQGVVHGDLKCGNVILSELPQGGVRAVITDFGLAKMEFVDRGRGAGCRAGTRNYMAPELLLGERPTVASDLYALGILFHVMLRGDSPKLLENPSRPRTQDSWELDSKASTLTLRSPVVDAHWQRTIEDLPSPWEKVVARCLAPRPENRFSSAEAVADGLETRRLLLKWSAAAVLAAAVTFGYWQWSTGPKGPPVRLAVLPFSVQGDTVESAAGMGLDVADRLSGSRRNFKVISPRESELNHADTPQKARSILGATHVLETRLNRSDGKITVTASLTDLASGLTVGEPLNGTYNSGDTSTIAKAIIATVTGTFRLRAGVPKESVSAPAYSYYVQGIELLRQDAYNADRSIPYLNKAVQLDPQSALPFAGLADAQIQKFQKDGGLEWLDSAGANVAKAKAINPDSVPVLLVSGSFQQEHGSYEHAINDFTRATELEPNNSETWKRLAGAYNRANRTDEAIATYQKAINAEPNYYANYLELGNLYWYRAQFREAEEQYRQVTKIAPSLSTGPMDLGLALMEEGRFQEAEEPLLQALRLHRSPRLLMNIGGLYYAQERYTEAAPFFEESVASGTPTAIRYRDLGDVYRHLGRNQEAEKAYRFARGAAQEELTRNPRRAYSRVMLALVSAFLGDRRRAQTETAQALAMEPENAIVLREAAITYEVLHQRDDTVRVLQSAPKRLLEELSRQPDVKDLQNDPRFQELLRSSHRENK